MVNHCKKMVLTSIRQLGQGFRFKCIKLNGSAENKRLKTSQDNTQGKQVEIVKFGNAGGKERWHD